MSAVADNCAIMIASLQPGFRNVPRRDRRAAFQQVTVRRAPQCARVDIVRRGGG